MPFGFGSMNCVGMRFAILEMKLTLIKLLPSYDVISETEMENPPVLVEGLLRKIKGGHNCEFKNRSQQQA